MIFFKYLAMNVKAALIYGPRAALVGLMQFATAFLWFAGLAMLFRRFGTLAGWSFAEVSLCFAVTNIAFALAEGLGRGFDLFSGMVRQGEFDRILLRPRDPLVQVLGARIELSRLGRLAQGAALLALTLPRAGIAWTPGKALALAGMIAGGAAVFTGIFILGATACFFTLEGLEVINIFTDGGRELASYPLPVYGAAIRRVFTFVVPLGLVNYLPLTYLTGRGGWARGLAPLGGWVFLAACVGVFRWGTRRYASAGS